MLVNHIIRRGGGEKRGKEGGSEGGREEEREIPCDFT